MKRFIKNCIVFMAIAAVSTVFAVFLFLLSIRPMYKYTFVASAGDKIRRLESIKRPKIILVGNSNLAFGIKSYMIEDELNMPVVNLGLHGSLGQRFHEEMAKYNIGKGDIVIVCHTWDDDNNKIQDHSLAWITIENHFHLYRLCRFDIFGMIRAFPAYFRRVWGNFKWKEDKDMSTITGDYDYIFFDIHGDFARPRPIPISQYKEGNVAFKIPIINDKCAKRLNKAALYCKKRGATLVVAGYPQPYGRFTPDKQLFIDAWQTIKDKLDFPVISNIEDYFFPYSYFWNTGYHLTDIGAAKRTERLISDIKRAGLVFSLDRK